MVIYFIIGAVALTVILLTGFFIGKKNKNNAAGDNLTNNLNRQIATLNEKIKEQDGTIAQLNSQITRLTADCEVQKATAQHLRTQHDALKSQYEQQLAAAKEAAQQTLDVQQRQNEKAHAEEVDRNAKKEKELSEAFQKHITELKTAYERQIGELKNAHDRQLAQVKENADKQIETLRAMNQKQVESQMKLIKEQMQATSEEILKRRQEELGERNKEQVSKIIDPLQQSFKAMQEAFDKSKAQQSEALTRLDETIKVNMQKSRELGETADRLTRALTGEVKVQGNFGELKLKQLLEDLELKEGEQFDTQETLRDKAGKTAKGDDGKGLIPDFILHFPNNRHVVVDSKMSLTDYERYMNAESESPEKTQFLHGHIESVRAQVRRLARKEYSRYLPEGYNRLNFAIMYVPIEGALNLALLNDTTLWRWAYDQGVLVLGPQTMYMNLRVLEMMWTQVRQLQNQQMMMDAANSVIERVQDFGSRFIDVEASMHDTIKKISKLKITTAESGPSIITAAKNLLKAGARENKKKKSLSEMDNTLFLDSDTSTLLPEQPAQGESSPK